MEFTDAPQVPDGPIQAPPGEHWISDDFVIFSEEPYATEFSWNGAGAGVGLRDESTNDINVYRTKVKPWCLPETAFFPEYRRLLFDNGIVSVLTKFLQDEIAGAGYYFDGPDPAKVKLVEDFWYNNNVFDQMDEIVLQGILFGTGTGAISRTGGMPTGFRRVDITTCTLRRDDNTGDISISQGTTDFSNNKFLLRFFKYPDSVHGISLVRPILPNVQALDNLFRDIPAAIKQLAYVDRILKLDLSSISDPDQRRTILRQARDAFKNYDSATTTVLVMTKDSQFGYAGTVDGSSGGQKRLDPVLPLIEPILMFVLLQFNVAPGEVVQQGANKAILREQRALAKKRIETLRAKFAYEVERQIIAPLLGETGRPTVQIRYPPDPLPPDEEAKILLDGYQLGIYSREEVRMKRGVKSEVAGTMIWDLPITRREISVRLQDEEPEEEIEKMAGKIEADPKEESE